MLQRLIYKPPVPLEPYNCDKVIFGKDGKLRRTVLKACYHLNINPNDLTPKTMDDFAEKDILENIQILRYNEYENKRRAKIESILEYLQKRRMHFKSGTSSLAYSKGSVGLGPSFLTDIAARKIPPALNFDRVTRPGKNDSVLSRRTEDLPHSLVFTERNISQDSTTSQQNRFLVNAGCYLLPLIKEIPFRIQRGDVSHSLSIGISGRDGDVSRMMEEKLEKRLRNRSIHKERLLNASVTVTKMEEEYREKVRKELIDKEEKWLEKKPRIEQMKQGKRCESDDKEKKHKEAKDQKQEKVMIMKRQAELIERLLQSEKKRKEESEKKSERVRQWNQVFLERYRNLVEKKEEEEERSPSPELEEIERKITESQERKEKFMFEKRSQAFRLSANIEEKAKRVQHDNELEEQRLIQHFGQKLWKGRRRLLEIVQKRAGQSPNHKKEIEVKMRLTSVKAQEKQEEEKRANEIYEKEKKAEERIRKKKNSLDNYIAERREVWRLKMNSTRQNLTMAADAFDKWIEEEDRSYREKTERIQYMNPQLKLMT